MEKLDLSIREKPEVDFRIDPLELQKIIDVARADNHIGSENAKRLFNLLAEKEDFTFRGTLRQQIANAVRTNSPGVVAPALRTADDFYPGQEVMFRQQWSKSIFVPAKAKSLQGDYIELDWEESLVTTFVPANYIGLFDKQEFEELVHRNKGKNGTFTNIAFGLRLSEIIDPSIDKELLRKILRQFEVNSQY